MKKSQIEYVIDLKYKADEAGGIRGCGFWARLKIAAGQTGIIVSAICLSVIITGAGIYAFAFFADFEGAPASAFTAGALDIALESESDFSPQVTAATGTVRTINTINEGSLDLDYDVAINLSGDNLCQALDIKAELGGIEAYNGSLAGFNLNNIGLTAGEDKELVFSARLANNNPSLQNKICRFDLIFFANQAEGAGFSDTEKIANTIESGAWTDYIVVNKVYYEVDAEHGDDPKHEWIELYNPNENPVSIKKWQICNREECETIDPDVTIPPSGYAWLAHDNSISSYWQIPANTEIIKQLGGKFEMDNDADMLILKDENGAIIDRMNWGEPDPSWLNYGDGLWTPGVPDAASGFMLGRDPNGYDTDQASDFKELEIPAAPTVKTIKTSASMIITTDPMPVESNDIKIGDEEAPGNPEIIEPNVPDEEPEISAPEETTTNGAGENNSEETAAPESEENGPANETENSESDTGEAADKADSGSEAPSADENLFSEIQ